jgi:hypothetical protein
MTPCSLVEGYQRLEEHSASVLSVEVHATFRRNKMNFHHHDKLKCFYGGPITTVQRLRSSGL